jgi:UDP-N-acetylmuramoyl-tripeptide--D-alanyl-D-alanine ligase
MNGIDPVARPAMMDAAHLARAVGGSLHGESVRFFGVGTDTRGLREGDLFVALKGDRFDGHDYLAEAFRRGAHAAMVARLVPEAASMAQVVVEDTRLGLGRLAAEWRARFAMPVIALTGSNGKTTVKEMIAAILGAHCAHGEAVLATEGNLNNDIGMPLTLLRLREAHQFAVIEMGMNHAGEIDYLTRIAQPTVALVNNAQRAHVGLLGSLEAIARAKGEIYAGLKPSGIAVVNEDDPHAGYWKSLNAGRRIVTFGLSGNAQVHGGLAASQLRVVTPAEAFAVSLQVAGEHNARNALAACAAVHALGIPARAMQAGLAGFTGVAGRLQRRRGASGGWVIDDSYNANPESMRAALQVLAAERARKVFVMGDMGELGDEAAALHREVGEYARERGVDALYALGAASREAATAFGTGARAFEDVAALINEARRETAAGATVLVKGSRFMQMERVAEALAGGDRHAA